MRADPPAGEIRQRAHDILQRAEFGNHESVLQRIVNWIGDLFAKITFGIGGGPGFLGNLVAIVIVAGIVFLAVLLVRALLGRTRIPKQKDGDELTIELEEGRDATDWRATPSGSRPRGSGAKPCALATASSCVR